ncbi:MAG TPA: universal stress protein [bacterium]|nr:universal stress protein [bacterium]
MTNFRRMLVATDLSEVSPWIYKLAMDMAHPTNADVIVAHIADYTQYIEKLREDRIGVADYLEGLRSTIRRELRSAGLPESVPVEVMMQQHTVPADIRALAARLNADLIIMGTHGRTGLRRALLGSVAEDVIRHAEIPVLVVPIAARQPDEQLAGVGVTPAKEGPSNV